MIMLGYRDICYTSMFVTSTDSNVHTYDWAIIEIY